MDSNKLVNMIFRLPVYWRIGMSSGLVFLLCYLSIPVQAQVKASSLNRDRTLATELSHLYDISKLPHYRTGSKIYQVSSYDTTGGNNDGFSGKYSYLRKTSNGDLVILDAKGAGVINRIWTPTPTDDTLDFYIDNMDRPAFSVQFSDLFSGEQYPFIAPLCGNEIGGYYCYLPIPFQKRCKIIFRGERLMFYQIQWRTYPAGTRVKNFDLQLTESEQVALKQVADLWQSDKKRVEDFVKEAGNKVYTEARSFEISPGETQSIFDLNEGGRIVGIEIVPTESFAGQYKQIDMQIFWDNENSPAVYCPVSDFFGYAFGRPSMQSLLLGSKGGLNYCYLPMPFDKRAKIALIYRPTDRDGAQHAMKINTKVYYTKAQRNKKKEGKLYTRWVSQKEDPEDGPHVFLNVKGRGHYVGTILQSQGRDPGMTLFFEGDDSTAVDGEFRMHGTGSEDYFNGGWYALLDRWDTKMSLPLHGSLTYSLPLARTGGYRLFLSDKLPFEERFFQSMEHGPTDNVPVKYTSLAFYYSDKSVDKYKEPTNAITTVYSPDTLMMYPQLMKFSIGGHVDMKFEGPLVLTGDNGSMARIDLSDIPAGRYKLYMDYNEDSNGGSFLVWQRQEQLTDKITTFNKERKHIPQRYLCDITIKDFKNTLTLRFVNDKDNKSLSLNRLVFIRIPEETTE